MILYFFVRGLPDNPPEKTAVYLVVIRPEVIMEPCIYTTQFVTWLDAALACAPTKRVCFRSNKRWATAAKLLEKDGTLPVLFRQQEDLSTPLACRFVAELVEICFADAFVNNEQRLAWLDERLWLQKETIQQHPSEDFPTWKSQYEEWEVNKFMKAETWYSIRNLCEIKALPLPMLRKLTNNEPIAPNFVRGYALCHYPRAEVEVIGVRAAAV